MDSVGKESIIKKFNTTAVCIPFKHYRGDLSQRAAEIKKMIDTGEVFRNKPCQTIWKTMTLDVLEKILADEYSVLSLDFQKISDARFKTEEKFVKVFSHQIIKKSLH